MKESNSNCHSIKGLLYRLRTWGEPGNPQLFLLYDWIIVNAVLYRLEESLACWKNVAAPMLWVD